MGFPAVAENEIATVHLSPSTGNLEDLHYLEQFLVGGCPDVAFNGASFRSKHFQFGCAPGRETVVVHHVPVGVGYFKGRR